MKVIKKIKIEEINNISLLYHMKETGKHELRFVNNCDNIIFESFIDDKLEKILEIDKESWNCYVNLIVNILNNKKYLWNNNYFVGIFGRIKSMINITNNKGEYIEILCKYIIPRKQFEVLQACFIVVCQQKGSSFREMQF